MTVGDFSSQKLGHYFGILLGRHFVPDDFDGSVDELRPALKDLSHHATDVFCGHSAKLRLSQRETEAVAAIWLTLRREVIKKILVIEGDVNERKWHVP